MSIIYGSLNVDERYSAILEPNLYFNAWMVPGKTYTDHYMVGPAGGIFVHKLKSTAATVGTPGRDFTDEATQDELIPILLNNNYQKSKKIYGVQSNAVSFAVAEAQLANATSEVREGVGQSGLACLITEGTASATTTAITAANVKAEIIKERAALSKAKGSGNVILCSPDFYASVLEAAGTQFVPGWNEQVNASGNVGRWLGFTFIEANGLSEGTNKPTYYNHAGTKVEVTTANLALVDFIMYDYMAFSAVANLEAMRLRDSENFVGTKAQVEMNYGFRVTNAGAVRVRKHASA